jgi:hypothetical protein
MTAFSSSTCSPYNSPTPPRPSPSRTSERTDIPMDVTHVRVDSSVRRI